MILRDFPAAAHQRQFVQCYRIVHFQFEDGQTPPIKLYPPKPENCLHFFLTDPFSLSNEAGVLTPMPRVMFNGQQTKSTTRYSSYELFDVQVVFQPTAIYRLTGMPASELTDRHLDGALLFSNNVYTVLQQLHDAKHYEALLVVLHKFVDDLIRNRHKECLLMDDFIQNVNTTYINNIESWAHASCMGLKQFERLFYQRAGINPKIYSRIVRFNKVYNYRNRFPSKTWLNLAMEFNYHDYQHLVRDYKTFTGCNPNQLHKLEDGSPENVLGLAPEIYKSRVVDIA